MAANLAQTNQGGKLEIRPLIQHFDIADADLFLGDVVVAFATLTLAIAFVLNKTIGLRVEKDDEIMGLDTTQHSETAYN